MGVNESLPELIARRKADLKATSVLDLYRRLPEGDGRITYETFRKLANGQQRGTKDDRTYRDVALICGVSENEVRAALDVPPTYGPFELPPRAQGLNPDERSVVMSVMDAILNARSGDSEKAPAPPSPAGQDAPDDTLPPLELLAAYDTGEPSGYEQQVEDQDGAETGSQDRGSNEPA